MTSPPPMLPQHLPRAQRGQGQSAQAITGQIGYLIQHLALTQEGGIGFVWDTPIGFPLPAHVLSMMGASTVSNAPKCGSGAHCPIRIWQNILPKEKLNEAYSNLHDPPHTVNDILKLAGLGSWHMPSGDTTNSTANPSRALPRLRRRPTPTPREALSQSPTTCLLMKDMTLQSPSPEVREILMGFTSEDTEAAGLTPEQRIHILGQCTDLNLLH